MPPTPTDESSLFNIATFSISIGALGIAFIRTWVAVLPILQKHRDTRELKKKFAQGPFDINTIESSTRFYIRAKCCNVDPSQEIELRHALVATREDLFTVVDEFLDANDNSNRCLLLLADSGTGKTSFLLNYYMHNLRRPKKSRHRISLVPLSLINSDKLIEEIPAKEETAIFLDSFDEDVRASEDRTGRLADVMTLCKDFQKILIACRVQFFSKDDEIPVSTGLVRFGPRKAGEKRFFDFKRLYLAPFDDKDINCYIAKKYPFLKRQTRIKAHAIIRKIPLLSVRPMLLAHVPELVKLNIQITHSWELYKVMVDAWIDRESSWTDKNELRTFSELLAIEIFKHRSRRKTEVISYEEVIDLAAKWSIQLKPWQISGRSLLNRDSQGSLKFAHRSIMEYLFVSRLVLGDTQCHGLVLTDQMKIYLFEMLTQRYSSLKSVEPLLMDSEVYVRDLNSGKQNETIASFKSYLSNDLMVKIKDQYARDGSRRQDETDLYLELTSPKFTFDIKIRILDHSKKEIMSKDIQQNSNKQVHVDIATFLSAYINEQGIQAVMLDIRRWLNSLYEEVLTLRVGPKFKLIQFVADVRISDFLAKHGLSALENIFYVNSTYGFAIEPVPPDFKRFIIDFVPLKK